MIKGILKKDGKLLGSFHTLREVFSYIKKTDDRVQDIDLHCLCQLEKFGYAFEVTGGKNGD